MNEIVRILRTRAPAAHIVVQGLLPRGSSFWGAAQWKWPNRFTKPLAAVNAAFQARCLNARLDYPCPVAVGGELSRETARFGLKGLRTWRLPGWICSAPCGLHPWWNLIQWLRGRQDLVAADPLMHYVECGLEFIKTQVLGVGLDPVRSFFPCLLHTCQCLCPEETGSSVHPACEMHPGLCQKKWWA